MEARSDPAQRWRLTVGRTAEAPRQTQRETTATWEAAILGSGVPYVPVGDGSTVRPRLQFGAAIPIGMAAEAEWLDILLTERWPRWRVREALEPVVPAGWRLIELEDVWLGGPALGGVIAGADYRVTLGGDPDPGGLEVAAGHLLQSTTLPREREKGGALVAYDLRPLILDVQVADPGPPVILGIRTRMHPSLGNGRPEEVVAALADATGTTMPINAVVRARLLLREDVDEPDADA